MATGTFAAETEINGLWYELVSKTKEGKVIQYKNSIRYKGDISIPPTVEYEDATYNSPLVRENRWAFKRNLSISLKKNEPLRRGALPLVFIILVSFYLYPLRN